MKIFIISLVVMGLLVGGAVFAQEITIEEEVTSEDLGIEDPGLLPTSPFYFFKEWGRGVQSFFTFNPIKKVELELRFVNEKAAEAKKIQELRGDDELAVNRAIENYRKSQEKLASRLQALSETSENPNIDKLLDKVAERIILHEKLFDEIELKVKSRIEVRDGIEGIRERMKVIVGRIAEKDEPEKLRARLENVFDNVKGGTLKHIRSVEFLDRVDEVLSEEKRRSLGELREVLALQLGERLEQEVGELGVERLKEKIKSISGDGINRTILLEEFWVRASDKLARVLKDTQEDLERDEIQGEELKEKSREQIERAMRIIAKLRKEIEEKVTSQAVKSLLTEAERHIVEAKEAFENESYGNAFGQARVAEAVARNALGILFRGDTSTEAVRILDRVETQLRDAVALPSSLAPDTTRPRGVVCTLEYAPVCGANGETFSNECFAKASGVAIISRGACKASEPRTDINTGDVEPKEPSSIINDIRTQLLEPLQINSDINY